jgi:protein ImuB
VAALNGAGHAVGLRVGQTLADARAIAPGLLCLAHDPEGDWARLRRLAHWAQRFSPSVTPLQPDPACGVEGHGLFLDACGMAPLFGGEAAWLADLLARLSAAGLSAGGALSDNPADAYALGVFHPLAQRCGGLVAPTGQGLSLMAGLPLASLRIAPAVAAGLSALGLKTVGALSAAPRAGLARRFGAGLLARIDAARGAGAEALSPVRAGPSAVARARLAQPLVTLGALEAVAERLCGDLARQLVEQGLGARRLALTLFCVDARALTLGCAASRPTQDAARLLRLLKERLARAAGGLDLGFGVDAMHLAALKPAPLAGRETGALAPEGASCSAAALEDLAERLGARLGGQAVLAARSRASHWPERAQRFTPAQDAQGELDFPSGLDRPPWLFTRPESIAAMAPLPDGAPAQFRWRRVLHRVARAAGPERIAAEWWRMAGPTRDYYHVETCEGRRLWLFRLGLYGGETSSPGWFVHGCWP